MVRFSMKTLVFPHSSLSEMSGFFYVCCRSCSDSLKSSWADPKFFVTLFTLFRICLYNISDRFIPKRVAKTQRVVGAFAPATARLRVQIAYAGPEIGFILMGPLRGAIWSLFFGSSVRSFKVKGAAQ